jgi:hypothetical protein
MGKRFVYVYKVAKGFRVNKGFNEKNKFIFRLEKEKIMLILF